MGKGTCPRLRTAGAEQQLELGSPAGKGRSLLATDKVEQQEDILSRIISERQSVGISKNNFKIRITENTCRDRDSLGPLHTEGTGDEVMKLNLLFKKNPLSQNNNRF